MSFIETFEKISLSVEACVDICYKKCLRSISRLRDCQICADNCPANAISIDEALNIDHKLCIQCGLCLRLCPVGAISGDDGVSKLLRCLQFLENVERIELVCNRNANYMLGPSDNGHVIQIDRCLAAYGPSVFLMMHEAGVKRISLRLDSCDQCELRLAKDHLLQSKNEVDRILSIMGYPEAENQEIYAIDEQWSDRQVVHIDNPPINRRSFFNLLSKKGLSVLPDLFDILKENEKNVKRPPNERLRLIKIFELLRKKPPGISNERIAEYLQLAAVNVSDRCSACGICAEVCPTGAIVFDIDPHDNYYLKFLPMNCINCGVCVDCCEMDAIQIKRFYLSDKYLTEKKTQMGVQLQSGLLRRCVRCHVKFSSTNDSELCPICKRRRENPFGFSLPAGYQLLEH